MGCTKWKCSETDGQPREVQFDPGIARHVGEHEKQLAVVTASQPPPPSLDRGRGRRWAHEGVLGVTGGHI